MRRRHRRDRGATGFRRAAVAVALIAGHAVAADEATHGDEPRALVFEHADRYTKARGAAALLRRAGFVVRNGDLGADYASFDADLVMLGGFVSESPDYARFMKTHAARLAAHVERGAVLWQWTQADQRESTPPFLPEPLALERADPDHDELFVLAPEHPLLAGLAFETAANGPKWRLPRHLRRPANWETIARTRGFRTLIASAPEGRSPALVEAAHGRGRFVITSLFLDKLDDADGKPIAPGPYRDAADRLARNLRAYVESVADGDAPAVQPTAPYDPPPPLAFVDGSWTLAVLPDTQVYVMRHPETFDRMTAWIAEQRDARRIAFVAHVGDLVNNNNPEQWTHARRSMAALDGVVDYAIAPGNHDLGPNGSARTRDTLFNSYFDPPAMRRRSTFGGMFEPDRLENTWHRFEAGAQKWLVIALEFGPRERVVRWANRILAKYADHRAILVTHAFTYSDDTRYDARARPDQHWNPHRYGVAKLSGGVNDGEELWTKLASRHGNVRLVLSGHVLNDGLGRVTSRGARGNVVHQLLANYQQHPRGGDGFLRLMEFLPDGRRVQVKTYSPLLDRYRTDPQNQFVLDLEPDPR